MKKKFWNGAVAFFAGTTLLAGTETTQPYKVLELDPETTAVKAGEMVHVHIKVEAQPGFVIRNWGASVIRKNSPADFFDKKLKDFQKHPTARAYDCATLISITYLPDNYTVGMIPVNLNTTGFAAGDYAITLTLDFIGDGKTDMRVKTLYLAVTAPDEKMPMLYQENEPPFRSFKLDCTEVFGAPNGVAAVKAEVALQPKVTGTGYEVYILRRDLPAAFAAETKLEVIKDVQDTAKDRFLLVKLPFRSIRNTGAFPVNIPLKGLPSGTYQAIVRVRAEKSGGSFRGEYFTEAPLKIIIAK